MVLLGLLLLTPASGQGPGRGRAEPDSTLIVSAVGDLMLGGRITPVLLDHLPDYPWTAIRSLLDSSGLLMGNLEAPFLADTTGVPRAPKTWTFAVPPSLVSVLLAGRFTAVTLANNHILDFGMPGLEETWRVVDAAGIARAGTGRDRREAHTHRVVEYGGHTIALLAYNHVFPQEFWARTDRPGTAHADDAGLAREVARARRDAEVVVVSFHWGGEGLEVPRDYQRVLAHIAVDAGADLVIGHHPHVIQPLEWYRGRLIAYSLGNFLFGSYSTAARGALLQVTFEEEGPRFADLFPLDVDNFRREFRPAPAPEADWPRLASRVVTALADSARSGAPGVEIVAGDRLRLYPPPGGGTD